MSNLQRDVWEGWTPQDFIDTISDELDLIMTGNSWRQPFKTRAELVDCIIDSQPYYKHPIPEVNAYFINRYGM